MSLSSLSLNPYASTGADVPTARHEAVRMVSYAAPVHHLQHVRVSGGSHVPRHGEEVSVEDVEPKTLWGFVPKIIDNWHFGTSVLSCPSL